MTNHLASVKLVFQVFLRLLAIKNMKTHGLEYISAVIHHFHHVSFKLVSSILLFRFHQIRAPSSEDQGVGLAVRGRLGGHGFETRYRP